MGARADFLRAEIDKAKNDLASHLAELRVEGKAAGRRAASRAEVGLVVLGVVAVSFLVIRGVLRRRRA